MNVLRRFIKEVLDGFALSTPHNAPSNFRYDVQLRPKASGDEEFDVDYEPDEKFKNSPYVDPRKKLNVTEQVANPGQKLAACVLILAEDGKVLAVSRRDDPTMFGLPGGKVDPGETPEQAAYRELEEETGLKASNLKHVFTRHADDDGFTTFTFTGKVSGNIASDEEGVIRWVSIDVLCDPKTSPFAPYNQRLFNMIGLRGMIW
jgi:8-oxo-dGTP pyrophosphatase MutT (NUDIX family)